MYSHDEIINSHKKSKRPAPEIEPCPKLGILVYRLDYIITSGAFYYLWLISIVRKDERKRKKS